MPNNKIIKNSPSGIPSNWNIDDIGNILKVRLQNCTKKESEWIVCTEILKDGEFGLASDTQVIRVGDGMHIWSDLPVWNIREGSSQGSQGNIGLQGSQGNIGLQGSQGNIGLQGIQGNIGLQGIQGPAGSGSGGSGTQGIQGIQGPAGSGGGGGDLSNYYTKEEANKSFIVYKDPSTGRVEDANNWWEQGYALTTNGTKNLPKRRDFTYKDMYGVLQFIPENLPNGTGTQLYFPIDGTYKGRVFTRSLTNIRRPAWSPTISEWVLLAIEPNPAAQQEQPVPTPQQVPAKTQSTTIKPQSMDIKPQSATIKPQVIEYKNTIDRLIVADASNYDSIMNDICDYFLQIKYAKQLELSIAQPILINHIDENIDKSYPCCNIIDYILTGFNGGCRKDSSLCDEFDFYINVNILTKSDRVAFYINDVISTESINRTNMNMISESLLRLDIKKPTGKHIYYNMKNKRNEINSVEYMDFINHKKTFIPLRIHISGRNWGAINSSNPNRFVNIDINTIA